MTDTISRSLAVTLLLAGFGLAGCKVESQEETPAVAEQASSRTVASALSSADNLDSTQEALQRAGLLTLLDGVGSYTLLAPTNAAFEALGPRSAELMQADRKPVLVGLLREHILPGHVTAESIAEAIEQQGDTVEMTTLGGGEVRFGREGDTLTATGPSGETARLVGQGVSAGNGALLTLDAVLLPAAATQAGEPAAGQ